MRSAAADVRRLNVSAGGLTSAHMKSEVKTDLTCGESQSPFLALGLAGQPFDRLWGGRGEGPFRVGRPACGRRGGSTRPCCLVVALRHTWGTQAVPGPGSLGGCRVGGTSQLRELVLPRSKPNVGVSPSLPDPRRRGTTPPWGRRTPSAARGFRGGLRLGSEKASGVKLPALPPQAPQRQQDLPLRVEPRVVLIAGAGQ